MKILKIHFAVMSIFLAGMLLISCSNDDVTPEIYDDEVVDSGTECSWIEGRENITLTASKSHYITGVDSIGSEVQLTIPKGSKIVRNVSDKLKVQIYIIEEDK